eukprot:3453427-Prymnesium_polylepis.1
MSVASITASAAVSSCLLLDRTSTVSRGSAGGGGDGKGGAGESGDSGSTAWCPLRGSTSTARTTDAANRQLIAPSTLRNSGMAEWRDHSGGRKTPSGLPRLITALSRSRAALCTTRADPKVIAIPFAPGRANAGMSEITIVAVAP